MSPALVYLAYDPDDVKPGWVALVLVLLLALATFLLWRSMNTQLRRINVPTKAELKQSGAEGATPDGAAAEGRNQPDARDPDDPRP